MSNCFWNARITGIIKANDGLTAAFSTIYRPAVFFPLAKAFAIRRKDGRFSLTAFY
jgi:hypothetical protein